MPIHYFAKDGSYGDAKNLVTITTTNWDPHMLDSIKKVAPESRLNFAQALRSNIHDPQYSDGTNRKIACSVCADLLSSI